MKRLLPLLLVLLWGQNMLLAQKAVLVRTQYESYAVDNETDSLLPEKKECSLQKVTDKQSSKNATSLELIS
ncbi:hypothetical protein [Capnocytophaga sputigena]|mgnify:CR=1 FL=1|uniref:hypothetical protein n=1 Tax=Capnocytophaga sputigena TaxID=1019 RepID=UPI00248E0344|nr:hypothetical protein [Capnocytophaga sputigena]